MSEQTEEPKKDKKSYWETLNTQFQNMQLNIETELQKMQKSLAVRNADMTDKLDSLQKVNDMFHSNMGKQLDFQSRLDKILEESNRRQLDMQMKFKNMVTKTVSDAENIKKKEESDIAPPPTEDLYEITV